MTNEERVQSLHTRMDAMRRVQERRKTGAIGAASSVLTICLILLVFSSGGLHTGGAVGLYSGTAMLFEGVGAYVLVAIFSFMVGAVTVVVIQEREKHYQKKLQRPPNKSEWRKER